MATTIAAPPERVWPWLVQMGCDRAGFYSFDRLDNGGRPSADRIHTHWQKLREGDRVRTGERIGEVGKTGNARGEFCQLHFELWPHGSHDGRPVDPAPMLRDWDAVSWAPG